MSMRATVRPRGGVSLKNMDRAALKRLVGYILRRKGMLVAVLICIALSSIANVASSLFLQSLIDDYIAPLLLDAAPVFTAFSRPSSPWAASTWWAYSPLCATTA